MKNYNQWANELNVSAYYIKPTPPASGHYFNSSVYCKPKSNLFMNLIKKLMGFLAVLILMSSCARYYTPYKAANTGGKTCSKWNRIR
jgi:hypothetical protein